MFAFKQLVEANMDSLAHTLSSEHGKVIADAKGEIFQGLEPGGTALIPHDNPHRDRLRAAAEAHAGRVVTFGRGAGADVRAREAMPSARGTLVTAKLPDAELTFTLAHPGEHWVSNAMAVLGAVWAVGGDLTAAGLALAEMEGLAGRGARVVVPVGDGTAVLIDESYNANPASMAATLASLGTETGRRLAVLGAMRELGEEGPRFHRELAGPLRAAGVAHAILVGPEYEELARGVDGVRVEDVEDAIAALRAELKPGDRVLVKGSNSVGLARLVRAMKGG